MTEPSRKILSFEDLEKLLNCERRKRRQIVLCHGVFDLLHPGHVLHFKAAREHGDILVVTVTPDKYVHKGQGRPVFNQYLRMETLAALEHVDYVTLNLWPTAVEAILRLRPRFYVKGREYADKSRDVTGKIFDEEQAIRQVKGRLIFTDEKTFSSSSLLNRFFSSYPPATREYLKNFRKRHSSEEIIDSLRRLARVRALIVGEAILDEYCYCLPMGKSPKETIVASKFSSEERFAGGAVATANHVAGFCKSVTLLTCVGEDEREFNFIRSKLRSNVHLQAIRTRGRPTVRKKRFLEPTFLTKMFEIQFMDDMPFPPEIEKHVGRKLDSLIPRHDLVIVNDFGHGLLTQRLRKSLSGCRRFMALNTQSNSANLGFNPVNKYRRADYICVDEPEMRLAALTQYGDITKLAIQLKREMKAGTFLVSLGPRGSTLVSGDRTIHNTPPMALRVVDRTGAGDALFAITSPCVYKGIEPDVLGFVGNCVGALAVEIVCNREPVDPVLLYKFMTGILK